MAWLPQQVSQVRGDLSGGAWWSSGDSRLATPEGPAGAHIAPCVVKCSWLLPLAGLTRTDEAGLWGFVNPHSTVGAGLQKEDGDEEWSRRQPGRGQAGERAAWRLRFR